MRRCAPRPLFCASSVTCWSLVNWTCKGSVWTNQAPVLCFFKEREPVVPWRSWWPLRALGAFIDDDSLLMVLAGQPRGVDELSFRGCISFNGDCHVRFVCSESASSRYRCPVQSCINVRDRYVQRGERAPCSTWQLFETRLLQFFFSTRGSVLFFFPPLPKALLAPLPLCLSPSACLCPPLCFLYYRIRIPRDKNGLCLVQERFQLVRQD